MRSRPHLVLATLLAWGLGALPAALGQDPRPAPKAPDAAAGALAERYAALVKEADVLAAAYRQALEAKVEALAHKNPTLARLREAGIFTVDALLPGVTRDDPLMALPYMKRAYEHAEETADDLAREFAGVAKAKNEQAAVTLLKKIAAAQAIFRDEDRDGNGILDYAETLYDLSAAGLKIPGVTRGQHETTLEGYKIRIQHADTLHWAADAIPTQPGVTGDRWFYVDDTTIVRAKAGAAADQTSEPVK
jgi:hypothetical protein